MFYQCAEALVCSDRNLVKQDDAKICTTESWLGVPYGIYGTRGEAELLIQYEAKLSSVSGN